MHGAICLSVFLFSGSPALARPDVIASDLALQFVCRGDSDQTIESAVESFLTGHQFKVLNKARVQQNHGVFIVPVEIIGIDAQRRQIDITLMPPPSTKKDARRYAMRINSPPPTEHDAELEQAALDFASKTLGCELRQVSRGENEEDAREFYDRLFKTTEGWFRQTEELESPSL